MSAEEHVSKASRVELANEWAVQANKQTDERLAQYFSLDSRFLVDLDNSVGSELQPGRIEGELRGLPQNLSLPPGRVKSGLDKQKDG